MKTIITDEKRIGEIEPHREKVTILTGIYNNKYEYPSHHICHITTLAHAMNIKNIHGFLYNTI